MATKKNTKAAETPVTETPVVEAPAKTAPKAKAFKDGDLIPCVSVTSGGLNMLGKRSGEMYDWPAFGETVEVQYRDLKYAVSARSGFIFKPRFIIQDKDFVEQNRTVKEAYKNLYTPADIINLLNLSADDLKLKVKTLPDGTKDALKGIVIEKINDGSFDSVQKVKALDDALGTSMMTALVG